MKLTPATSVDTLADFPDISGAAKHLTPEFCKNMLVSQLETRLSQHQATRAQLIAQLQAYEGAIQETTYWIEQVKATQTPDTKPLETPKEPLA